VRWRLQSPSSSFTPHPAAWLIIVALVPGTSVTSSVDYLVIDARTVRNRAHDNLLPQTLYTGFEPAGIFMSMRAALMTTLAIDRAERASTPN